MVSNSHSGPARETGLKYHVTVEFRVINHHSLRSLEYDNL